MTSILGVIDQGLIFSLVAIAVYLTSGVINKDDFSIEGSFGLGSAITAVMIERTALAWPALLTAVIAGALVGMCTGTLYTRLRMNHLMAGLVSTTACFSIALVLASSNKIVREDHTIFAGALSEPLILLAIAGISLVAVMFLMRSEVGLLLRSVGENPGLLTQLGKSANAYYIMGFAIANAASALAGSLFVQWSGYFSITGNIGVLITGIATLMIAELVSKKLGFAIIAAAVVYQSIFLLTLELGVDPRFNNLIKATVMVLLMVVGNAARRRLHA